MQECENQKRITAVAIGDFDGMHRAHNIVCTGAEQVIIYCVHNRFSLLQKSIFQRRYPTAVFADFDAIRNMDGRQFVEDVLIGRFGAGMVLCGFNFRFGKNAAWDAMRLRAYLEDRGIWVRILEHQDYQGAPISSTRIRAAVQAGEMEQAAAMLGYNFTFENPVLHGDAPSAIPPSTSSTRMDWCCPSLVCMRAAFWWRTLGIGALRTLACAPPGR